MNALLALSDVSCASVHRARQSLRGLAYLVCSPRLLKVNARTIDQMRLANALCRFAELAEEVK